MRGISSAVMQKIVRASVLKVRAAMATVLSTCRCAERALLQFIIEPGVIVGGRVVQNSSESS